MRRIDLLSKLSAPVCILLCGYKSADEQLFVSVLTSTIGYIQTTLVLLTIAVVTLVTEFIWIQVVYRNFPILAVDSSHKDTSSMRTSVTSVTDWFKREKQDWAEFSRLPIFFSQSLIF